MKNLVIILAISFYIIIGFNCKGKSANEFIISQNIDTTELKYERVFPEAYRNYFDSVIGYHGKKGVIKAKDKNNFAIIYLNKHNTQVRDNALFGDNRFISAFTNTFFKDDTLSINANKAFFEAGDLQVVIHISGKYFAGYYYEHADGLDNFKYTLMSPLTQTLVLDKAPAFEYGKILTGRYEGTFRRPSDNHQNTDTAIVRVKVIFRCVEKQLLRL